MRAFASGGYAGIGIACFEPLRLVDVDGCIVNGKAWHTSRNILYVLHIVKLKVVAHLIRFTMFRWKKFSLENYTESLHTLVSMNVNLLNW